MRDFFNRLLRRGQTNAHRRLVSQRFQTFQRQRQMRSALVVGDGVNFIDNHRLNIAQNRAALIRGQQNVKRLRRGDQNVRRPLQHGAPLGHQRVAGADRGANLRHQQPALARHRENFPQRHLKIFLNVVAQRLQRRNVEDFGAVRQIARQRLAHQPINAGEKCSQRFARARGRGDQRGAPGQNVRPALLLRLGRRAKPLHKPLRHQRMGPGQRGRKGRHSGIVAGRCSFVNHSLALIRSCNFSDRDVP